jgi:hypothetical protein
MELLGPIHVPNAEEDRLTCVFVPASFRAYVFQVSWVQGRPSSHPPIAEAASSITGSTPGNALGLSSNET